VAGSARVRSGEILSQVWPKLVDRYR